MGNCGSCWFARVKAEASPHHSAHGKPDDKHMSDENGTASNGFNTKQKDGNQSQPSAGCALRPFTFAELKAATRNFRSDCLLGEGGFGRVFKGWVDEQGFMATRPGTGIVIAVKKLNLEGLQGHKEWLAEVHFLGQLHHPNLVRLLGFCAEDDHRLLVYEFMPRGSFENHLFRRGGYVQALSWAIRIKVAVGAARGLAFLHEAERPVIFRDFKTSNILLDSRFNAKLSDFGLAKDGPTGDNTHVSTRVMGTYGYAAPEYVATGHLTAKSDVYSFGVVLLEILTGRRAVDKNKPYGEQNLVEWARPFLSDKRKVFRIVDPRLEGQYSMKGAYRAATLALSCLGQDAKLRPSMKEVVHLLEPLLNFREVVKHSHHQCSVQQQAFVPQQPIDFPPWRFPPIQPMPSLLCKQPYPSHLYHKYSLRKHHHHHPQEDLAQQCQPDCRQPKGDAERPLSTLNGAFQKTCAIVRKSSGVEEFEGMALETEALATEE